MAFLFMGLLLFVLSMAVHSSGATYCLCNGGLSDSVLQQNIDYACGIGADCTPIHQGGSCFTPNTVKDHCNYAVNSYFQKKGQVSGSCDFKGTATPSANPPSPTSGCVYPSSSSGGGTPTSPGTGTGSTVPGSPFPVGLGPTGGDNNPDGSGSGSGRLQESSNFLYSTLGFLFSRFVWFEGLG